MSQEQRDNSTDALRAVYREAVAKQRQASRTACPTPDELAELAALQVIEVGSPQVARFEHALSCEWCRSEYELLRATHVASRDNTFAGSPRKVAPSRTLKGFGIAAALLIAAGVGGTVWQNNQSHAFRTADLPFVVLVSPGPESMRGTPFVWHQTAGAASYHIEVLDTAGAVVVQQTTSDTTVSFSAADSAKIYSLNEFDWMVRASRIDGNERSSRLLRVRVIAR